MYALAVASQSPFGFKFTRNKDGNPITREIGTILSQSPFGFKFTRNSVRREPLMKRRVSSLNRLSALSSLGTSRVLRKNTAWPVKPSQSPFGFKFTRNRAAQDAEYAWKT